MATIDEAVAACDFGMPTAVKRGRNPKWPYVPVVDHGTRTDQIRGMAFATRAEAIEYAGKIIEARRTALTKRLADPRSRALREQHGLPRELHANDDVIREANERVSTWPADMFGPSR